ncbi:MAG: hypothetical protein HOP13_13870 [Alphaproteobacteria bacterium]|nr:hypothetical protein [Alphaproteobacteria bacterium]
MALFPPSTNADYTGAPAAVWFLVLAALLGLVPGCIDFFLPDGGAGVIAGIDLSTRGETIIRIFAWFGALQIAMALLLLTIAARYRTLVPLGLVTIIISRGLMSHDAWLGKGADIVNRPPENYGSPVAVVLALVFLVLALRRRT